MERQPQDAEFLLLPMFQPGKPPPTQIPGVPPIRKWHYKAKNAFELTDEDYERFVIPR